LGFLSLKHNQLAKDDLPQNEVASLIQRLFPATAHDVLASINLIHDHLRKWLVPSSIARLLSFIEDQSQYKSLSLEERLIDMIPTL